MKKKYEQDLHHILDTLDALNAESGCLLDKLEMGDLLCQVTTKCNVLLEEIKEVLRASSKERLGGGPGVDSLESNGSRVKVAINRPVNRLVKTTPIMGLWTVLGPHAPLFLNLRATLTPSFEEAFLAAPDHVREKIIPFLEQVEHKPRVSFTLNPADESL